MGGRPYFMALTALALSGCPLTCTKPTAQDLARHEIRHVAYWGKSLEMPLEDRIGVAAPEVVEYLGMDNEVNAFEAKPEAATLTDTMRADIVRTFAALPPGLRRRLEEKLLGIFVVKGLGSSAYTDFVRQGNTPVAAFVVIDVDAMNRRANDWLTWKESSPFTPEPTWRLQAVLEAPADDTIANALQFVLIHEFGHVVAFDEDVHPLWVIPPKLVDPLDYPFMDESWTVKDERYARRLEATDPAPGPIVYYKPSFERPSATMMHRYYAWLARSNFVTLYAATSPFDDFADALATYVHTVQMGKPFEIRLYEKGELKLTVPACWTEPRCAAKRAILEDFLK